MNHDPHQLTLAERNALQALRMIVGDDTIALVAARFRQLEAAWTTLIPPETHKGASSATAHKTLAAERPDLFEAWAGKVRRPTETEVKDGHASAVIVRLGWHQFFAKYHAGHATLTEFQAQIDTANALLDKYGARGAAKIEPIDIEPIGDRVEMLGILDRRIDNLVTHTNAIERAAVEALRQAEDARALVGTLASRLDALEKRPAPVQAPNGQPPAP